MQQSDVLPLEGQVLKVVYDDGGPSGQPTVVRGRLVSTSTDSIVLETKFNVLIVALSCVLKIQCERFGGHNHGY
ncbi:hypothetical protein ACFLY8_02310 [Halobacteriota archaeon]